jgi:subtilase family serine protease
MVLASAISLLGGGAAMAAPVAVAAVRLMPAATGHIVVDRQFPAPPTTAECVAELGIACYEPFQLQRAYDLQPLFDRGINGRGETIVIVDAFGSPSIASDLQRFDRAFGLPAPPSFNVITPEGAPGPLSACGNDPFGCSDYYGWTDETSLDVEWSHAMAPEANILLVESPTSETEGIQGFPDIVAAENFVIDHHLGDVITQSFGATEQTFASPSQIYGLESAYRNAEAQGVTVLASSGDQGATDYLADSTCCYTTRAIDWPASDPLVTAVGGTQLHLNNQGYPTAPASVWNDPSTLFVPGPLYTWGASGGGLSTVFSRPAFQDGVARVVGNQRGTPDISMSAAVNGAVDFYDSTDPSVAPGWSIVGGTSEASPLFSGVVALADQEAGHSLGYINPALYQIATQPGSGIVPVVRGNNTFTFCTSYSSTTGACTSAPVTVNGFQATPFYNDATGWGTVDAAQFVPALARSSGHRPD